VAGDGDEPLDEFDDAPPLDDEDFLTSVDAMLQHLQELIPMPAEEFARLEEIAHQRAFTVANVADLDLVSDVWEAIDAAVRNGETLEDFRERVGQKLADAWGGEDPSHLETIFRTNVHSAYSAGRAYQNSRVKDTHPYLHFSVVDDDRTCFAAGTLVRMADGRQRQIEMIRPGDSIISCRGAARDVVATSVRSMRTWGRINLSNGKTLNVTPKHPVLTQFGWAFAADLKSGAKVVISTTYDDCLSRLWKDVHKNHLVSSVLLDRVHDQAQTVLGVRPPLPSDAASEELLLCGLRGAGEGLRVVQQDLQSSSCLCSEGQAERGDLFGEVQEPAPAQRLASGCYEENVHQVRGGVQCSSGKQTTQTLLGEMQGAEGSVELSPVRSVGCSHDEGGSVLFDTVLPEIQRRDGVGDRCQVTTDGGRHPFRAGSEDRPLVSGLPDRKSNRAGGGRRLLALKDQGQGCIERCRNDEARLDSYSPLREGSPAQPERRHRDLETLWPRPVDDLSGAEFADVVSVDWSLTEPRPAYDIQVESDAGFIAEGVVVHNSDICEDLIGVTLPQDDPFIAAHQPPLHYRCRTDVVAVTEEEAREYGIDEVAPDVEPDEGFGGDPLGEFEPDLSTRPAEMASIYELKLIKETQ
jgi:hypothetical protein